MAEANPVTPTWLRSQCGHDSHSVKGCGHCEAADELVRLQEVYRREREAHAANLKEQQKCEAEIERLRADLEALDQRYLRLLDDYQRTIIANAVVAKLNAEQAETIERLRQQLEAFNAHPPLLVDGKTGKVTPLVDAANLQIEVDRLREALEQLKLPEFDFQSARFDRVEKVLRNTVETIAVNPLRAETRAATSGSEVSQIEDAGRPEPFMYSTSYCEKHRNMPWSMTVTATTAPPRVVCPLCEPPSCNK